MEAAPQAWQKALRLAPHCSLPVIASAPSAPHIVYCVGMAADDALAVALSAQLQLGGGLSNDGMATLRALPDPLALLVMQQLDGPDLARRARSAARAAGVARP